MFFGSVSSASLQFWMFSAQLVGLYLKESTFTVQSYGRKNHENLDNSKANIRTKRMKKLEKGTLVTYLMVSMCRFGISILILSSDMLGLKCKFLVEAFGM